MNRQIHKGIFLAVLAAALYATAPFISAALSMVMLREKPDILYLAALLLMMIGAWLSSSDEPLRPKREK